MFLCPHYLVSDITDLSPAALKESGVTGVLLDIDNTLTHHHSQDVLQEVARWLAAAKEAGLRLILVSNAKKRRVAPFADKLGLPYISLACKPLPTGYRRAAKRLGVKRSACVAVGDQVFTDLLAAKCAGVKMALTTPFEEESGWSFRVRRRLERAVRRRAQQRHTGGSV